MKKIREKNLTSSLIYRLLKDLSIGIFIFAILNIGGKTMLRNHLFISSSHYKAEYHLIEQFQSYVTEHSLSVTDTEHIRSWVEERNIQEFILSKEDSIYFDNTYQENIFPGSIRKTYSRYLHQISFRDGPAQLYIYNGSADTCYDIITWISVILSITLCLMIFGSEFQEEIKIIQYLRDKVDDIGDGNLTKEISTDRADELG